MVKKRPSKGGKYSQSNLELEAAPPLMPLTQRQLQGESPLSSEQEDSANTTPTSSSSSTNMGSIGSSSDSGSDDFDGTPIRPRQRFTVEQTRRLEQVFQGSERPSLDVKRGLAEEFETEQNRIQIWFQNRRAKQKKVRLQQERSDSVPAQQSSANAARKGHRYGESSRHAAMRSKHSNGKKRDKKKRRLDQQQVRPRPISLHPSFEPLMGTKTREPVFYQQPPTLMPESYTLYDPTGNPVQKRTVSGYEEGKGYFVIDPSNMANYATDYMRYISPLPTLEDQDDFQKGLQTGDLTMLAEASASQQHRSSIIESTSSSSASTRNILYHEEENEEDSTPVTGD